jgi:sugar phosphate isomerase/epimerase
MNQQELEKKLNSKEKSMKLGFVSAILDSYSFEQMIDFASQNGFECVEVACWPKGKAERRYAGVSHIDVASLDDEKVAYIKEYCAARKVELSSLAYYPNTLDPDLEKRTIYVEHLNKLIDASAKLGIYMITTFIGRDPKKTVSENLELVKEVWPSIIKHAEEKKVKVAIENCPMLFTENEWPGGQNLMTSPANWRKVFEILDSEYFGLNYDPSHFVWQQIDYIKPIYDFSHKIFHVHYKDIKVYREKLADVGIMATPLEYMSPKLPGLGDVDWGKYVSALTDIRYTGNTCIEIEDKAFEGSNENLEKSLILSQRYLKQFVI